jgi:hypothetical protein
LRRSFILFSRAGNLAVQGEENLTKASLGREGYIPSSVSDIWVHRDTRRAFFKGAWDAADSALLLDPATVLLLLAATRAWR